MAPEELVERFYSRVWNEADEGMAREILDPGFRFRGSLGAEKVGVEGFVEYMRAVHRALAGYTCTIEDMVTSPGRAAVRLRFSGRHRGEFFGVSATGRDIAWAGAAFFGMDEKRIRSLWVLGDVDAVKAQLGRAAGEPF